jgi:hypothetical protein
MDNVYINIGSPKCCLFVSVSLFMIKQLEKNPFLYYAVEESLECAKNEYYAAGILTFSQLLNSLNKSTPKDRNRVAHEILKFKPTKEMYERVKNRFEKAATAKNKEEQSRYKDLKEYEQKVHEAWTSLMAKFEKDGIGAGYSAP